MIDLEDILIVIPARGGSKRIPYKNIKNICGQPMIYWPLMEISKIFRSERVIVSTDDKKIQQSVSRVGINTSFKRPKNLSDDFTGTIPVASHALQWFQSNICEVKYVVMIYPTAVTLAVEDILDAIDSLNADPSCDSIMTATHFPFPIQRAVFQGSDGYAKMFEPNHYYSRSQDLVDSFHDAGQFYVFRAESLTPDSTLVNSNTRMHILHRRLVIDIDTIEDFEIAEQKMKLLGLTKFSQGWSFA